VEKMRIPRQKKGTATRAGREEIGDRIKQQKGGRGEAEIHIRRD
jgi:hypothetical protein